LLRLSTPVAVTLRWAFALQPAAHTATAAITAFVPWIDARVAILPRRCAFREQTGGHAAIFRVDPSVPV